MPRKQKKYHFIYKTTNLITNKFYVGMHSTDDLEDGYFGSGKIAHYSVNKYGIENHQVEILEFLPSREELKKREAEVVNEELLKHPLCMNLKFGGEGGWDHLVNDPRMQEVRSKNGITFGSRNGSKSLKALTFEDRSNHAKIMWEADRESKLEKFRVTQSAANSEKAKAKRKETLDKINFQKGENNSQFGTCWINNGVEVKKIKKEELSTWLIQGWKQGRKLSCA
jgi:hypothetical protein